MKLQERIKKMMEGQEKKGGGGPSAMADMGAEAEIVVRGPDGKVKGKYKAEKTEITL